METVMMLFEGVCPVCQVEVEIVEVSGTEQFLQEFTFEGEFGQRVWRDGDGLYDDGMVRFVCQEGHERSAFHTPHGDWVA